ncbi:CU044_2847 family protein [Streptomyces purpurogeneiscleroticus]|uniref:CU044_2847 family protein n=1 Tax=Streptomyces purpurogeneiscleroticus TaxID=68259 RepID=UPI001CC0E1D4|nr:CU044_2847 family protein [Streptomyces purpurogeneiscleroticus]
MEVPLEGGGVVLFEAGPEVSGPVKAGRVGEAVHELPQTLQECLEPVSRTVRAALQAVQQAGPDGVEMEFGVKLSAQAGAVITKGRAEMHLMVRVQWQSSGPAPDGTG